MEKEMRKLVDRLNYLTMKYDEGNPEVSDQEWDDMYFELLRLENLSKSYYPDSPTRAISFTVVNELKKVEHNHPMLSLDKTKNLEDVQNFAREGEVIAMTKCDGLTCSLRYENGYLVSAETRGNGFIGEDILHNAIVCPSIPRRISYLEELIIDGEIVCLTSHFDNFSEEYANPRNFAAGSIRLLDSKECAKRMLTFIAWDVIEGFNELELLSEKLSMLSNWYGFTVVPFVQTQIISEDLVQTVRQITIKNEIPMDGIVFKYNNISFGKQLGATAHHFKNAIAYKFYDDLYLTALRNIQWTMGRTGVLTPIAIFDAVEIDGSKIERASLHNLSILKSSLGDTPWNGQTIGIYKANMIIPQIGMADVDTVPEEENIISFPKYCPICDSLLNEKTTDGSIFLECSNDKCEGKFINKLEHFCGKKGLDIKGLSKATLEKLSDYGWINNIIDIYSLSNHRQEWIKKPGFGPKSVDNILTAIEESRDCSFESFISSLGIPLIGQTLAKELTKHFDCYEDLRQAIDEKYDFSKIDGFAISKTDALLTFNFSEADELYGVLDVRMSEKNNFCEQPLKDMIFVITGSIKQFKNRAELQKFIEEKGGKVVGSVSKNVNYLINNDSKSTTSKNIAAKKLGIKIINEQEFFDLTI